MIQMGSYLLSADNSGAKFIGCIQVMGGYKKRYARVGGLIVVSVKSFRARRRQFAKVKKGAVSKAVIVRTRSKTNDLTGNSMHFLENAAVLLTKQNKVLGTRVFGVVPKSFRFTKFLRIASLSAGFAV